MPQFNPQHRGFFRIDKDLTGPFGIALDQMLAISWVNIIVNKCLGLHKILGNLLSPMADLTASTYFLH